jgi:excisionase family DNA binding protein
MMSDEQYLTIEQVAGYYRVSVSTVRVWIRQSVVPFLKIGGVYRLKVSEIDAVFKQYPKPLEQAEAAPVVEQVTVAIAPEAALVINPDQDV